jgi:hypothetical protein
MPSDPLDNNANHNNSNRLCFEYPLQWVLRDEDNELNVNPRHFSNAQNNIVVKSLLQRKLKMQSQVQAFIQM